MAPQKDEITGRFETEEEITSKFRHYAAESTAMTCKMKCAKKKGKF
jgi:hypothetical protein